MQMFYATTPPPQLYPCSTSTHTVVNHFDCCFWLLAVVPTYRTVDKNKHEKKFDEETSHRPPSPIHFDPLYLFIFGQHFAFVSLFCAFVMPSSLLLLASNYKNLRVFNAHYVSLRPSIIWCSGFFGKVDASVRSHLQLHGFARSDNITCVSAARNRRNETRVKRERNGEKERDRDWPKATHGHCTNYRHIQRPIPIVFIFT